MSMLGKERDTSFPNSSPRAVVVQLHQIKFWIEPFWSSVASFMFLTHFSFVTPIQYLPKFLSTLSSRRECDESSKKKGLSSVEVKVKGKLTVKNECNSQEE